MNRYMAVHRSVEGDRLYRERGDYGAGEYRPRPWPPVVSSQQAALPTVEPSRLDRLRVRTDHEPFRPLCPRCRRPYDPDSPLQAGHKIGCYQCGPDERPPQASADGPASITAQLREKEEWLARLRARTGPSLANDTEVEESDEAPF